VYFVYHKEGHTIRLFFKLFFSHLKNIEGEGRQDRKLRHKNDGDNNKKKAKLMQAMWSVDSDNSNTNGSGTESGEDQELNPALMAYVKDGLSPIDIDGIIASKNISDESTIELLRNIVLSKNKKLKSKQQESTLTPPP
jgi:hypothetical protein